MSGLSPGSRRIAVFAAVSVLGVSALLAACGEPTVFQEIGRLATGTQGVDSWRPMNQAHLYLSSEPVSKPLYTWLFFEQRIKFIYPPTSLLWIDAIVRVVPRAALQGALNLLSGAMVALTLLCSALLAQRSLEASPRTAATGSTDRHARLALLIALALGFYPVLKAYSLGQMQVFVNAGFAAFLLCWVTDRRRAAGVLVALMAAVKPQYGVLLLWGLLRGERRFASAAALTGVALLAVSLARFGWESHVDYLSVLAHVSRLGEAYWPNQTVAGFLHRLLGNGVSSHWDPHVYPPYHVGVHAGSLLGTAILLGLALFWRARDAARGGWADASACTLALTLSSPVAWEHHYGVLLPVFALLLPALLAGPGPVATVVGVATAYLLVSNPFLALGALSDTPWNPLQSLLFFAALGIFVQLLRRPGTAPPRESVKSA